LQASLSMHLENVQISNDASGGGLLKPSECHHMGEVRKGDLAKSSYLYNFYSGSKTLNQ